MHAADHHNIVKKLNRCEFLYAPFYCEENAFHLAAKLLGNQEIVRVIFISNEIRACLLMYQKAADPGQAVYWDYHVIVTTGKGKSLSIWDLDTRLLFPCPARDYLELTFPYNIPLEHRVLFRSIEAKEYLQNFSSDRRHMRNTDGTWIQTPPPWPPIRGSGASTDHDLEAFLNLEVNYTKKMYLNN